MNIDKYMEERLEIELQQLEKKLPRLLLLKNTLQFMTILLTALSTAWAAQNNVDVRILVPVSLAIAGLFNNMMDFFQLEANSRLLHHTVAELKRIKLTQERFNAIEKRLSSIKTDIIQKSETAILSLYKYKVENDSMSSGKEENETYQLKSN